MQEVKENSLLHAVQNMRRETKGSEERQLLNEIERLERQQKDAYTSIFHKISKEIGHDLQEKAEVEQTKAQYLESVKAMTEQQTSA